MSRSKAQELVKEHGSLTRILIFGVPAARTRRRPPACSYRRKMVTAEQLRLHMDSSSGTLHPLSPDSLRACKTRLINYYNSRKKSREDSEPFDEQPPACTLTPHCQSYMCQQG